MKRLVLILLVLAGLGVGVGLIARGSDDERVPEGGSAFGGGRARDAGSGREVSLLDALAPLLAGGAASAGGGGRSGSSGPATKKPQSVEGLPLPLDRAAAQVFLMGFEGTEPGAPFFRRLRARGWGGVVLEAGNYVEPGQLTALAGEVAVVSRDAGHSPALVAAVQPGGEETAFPNLPPAAQPQTPGPGAARRQAKLAGRQLRTMGIQVNLAPSADLRFEGGPWEERAYSDDPAVVARAVSAAVEGYRVAGVVAAVGHFPGEGGASGDPSQGAATVGLSIEELRARDLRPFAAAVARTHAIQMSNALYAAFDAVTPATLLPEAVGLARELGFRGAMVSADLSATTLATGGTAGDAAVAALNAGCDLLWIPGDAGDQEAAYHAVVRAVRTGELETSRLAQALRRVAALKRALGLR